MKYVFSIIAVLVLTWSQPVLGAKKKKKEEEPKSPWMEAKLSGLKLRHIGPALTSGRIADFAVDPSNRAHFYVAVCSGGVWETHNAGTTWKPIFDSQGSYSIGCITMDPNQSHVLWVGTGENNSQRSVGYGDGVYRSLDGGASWEHMGLKDSEHIGKILVHPKDSQTVFVASQGPLWRDGGDRGLFRTKDGGKTWENVLKISPHTGVNEVMMDPRNPDILYASSYQRRRHVWTLINGGPESTIYKSIDGGDTWFKQGKGLPGGDLGRIGMAIAPTNPDILYAIVEAEQGKSGFYGSTNGGNSWEKRSSYVSNSPQYYQEISVDPTDENIIYSMDTFLHRSIDGGRTFVALNKGNKHVDNHAVWIDPADPRYVLIGCDGGIYESFDFAKTWKFMSNLSVTQFYRITADTSYPFYFVYGGTQDNFSLGAPSRTTTVSGITNADWFVTLGGDGYKSQIDPENPNIIYAQYQYGGLARFDKQSGERVYIQPKPSLDSVPLKWNWNTPLIISPHNHKRLYYGSNVLFRSEDRGNSWEPVSPDLSRQIDRNELEVMGRVWPVGAVAKNKSTSFYGSMVSLSESELVEGLIYAGMDDGLIQITADGGANWTRYESFSGVPKWTYVSALIASQHNENRVYAAFDNHKNGDFKPYICVSEDRGNTWKAIQGNLPEKGTVYALAEDHASPDLLFAGTEFGLFFTADLGQSWVPLKSGLPVIAVRDLSIQERENDLVLATFGRGIYILDNYAPLRELTTEMIKSNDHLFAVKDAWQFIVRNPLGYDAQGQQGDGFFYAENPDYGAVFSYYLHEGYQSLKDKRLEKEKKLIKDGKNPGYPTWEELEKEEQETAWKVFFEVKTAAGEPICRLEGANQEGLHRVAWNLRYPSMQPPNPNAKKDDPYKNQTTGHLALPGDYVVSMFIDRHGEVEQVGEPRSFKVKQLGQTTLPAEDQNALLAFRKDAAKLYAAVSAIQKIKEDQVQQIGNMKRIAFDTPEIPKSVMETLLGLEKDHLELTRTLSGDTTVAKHNEATLPGLVSRVSFMSYASSGSLSAPTQTQLETFNLIKGQYNDVVTKLKAIQNSIEELNKVLESKGAPWTPGRIPDWPVVP